MEESALPVQDMLSTEILMCNNNTLISWNCIAIASKKLHVQPGLHPLECFFNTVLVEFAD